MKTYTVVLQTVAACMIAVALPTSALAQVSQDDFNALKKMVEQLGGQVQKLEGAHEQDQKTHQQDQQEIQHLKQQLGETQATATNAMQKAESAAQVQPVHPVPPGPSALHNFTMVGDAEVQFGKVHGSHSAFAMADFAPIFLFRGSDKVLVEAGFDIALQNNADTLGNRASGHSTTVDLSFATVDYMLHEYATFLGGYMLLPLGTYSERSAGWLNKIPDDPMVRDVLPGNGAGVQLRGAVPVGRSGQSISYALYGANGPSSSDGSGKSSALDLDSNVGITSDGGFGNLHGSPSGGGRVGWFCPVKPHWDLELGLSGQTGHWDDAEKHLWSAGVLDASLHLSPFFEAKGEYIRTWAGTDDMGMIHPRGWWLQAGYKLAGMKLELPYINNVELVGRYDTMNDGLGTHSDRCTAGYVYYFSNTLLFEGDYEFIHSRGPNALPPNQFVFQLSYGY